MSSKKTDTCACTFQGKDMLASCNLLTKTNWDPNLRISRKYFDCVNTTVEPQMETLLRLVHRSCLAAFSVRSTWYG